VVVWSGVKSLPESQQPGRHYAVLQAGARMHYAVPALLARAGALAAFYTDLHASHRCLQALNTFLPKSAQPRPLRRLLGRQLPSELPRRLVRDQLLLSLTWARGSGRSDTLVLKRACRERFAGANAVYTNFINNDLDTVQQAKDFGLHVVHELIITADVGRMMIEERQSFPGMEPDGEPAAVVEQGIAHDRRKWSISDQVLVPSAYCQQTAVSLGCDPDKISLVPYGIPLHWFNGQATPQPGRILFVGQVGLRKGNHYLAEALRLLQARGVACECRVVGPCGVDVNHPLFAGPDYLGQIPRSQVRAEFLQADVFVLPTLAEGMALVHLEAMASGVPVITTPNCGSVVRDGMDGFIVPIRDSRILADRLQQLIEDRSLRESMGESARSRASDYSWDGYSQRLLNVLLPSTTS